MVNTIKATEGRLINGVVRTPGPTFQDIRSADPNPGPDDIYGENPTHTVVGDKFRVDNSVYFSAEYARKEKDKLWPNVWRVACRVESIQKVGGCYVHDFLDDSIVIVRISEQSIKAFRNTCRHRGNQLRKPGSCDVITKFFCPYHGASWKLDGSTERWPFAYDFTHLEDNDFGLLEVAVKEFQGFIFICSGDNPPDFEAYAEPLTHYMNGRSWAQNYPVLHLRKPLKCNWKILVQAFNEGIHIPITHPQGRPYANVTATQVDIINKYITRQVGPVGIPGDTLDKPLSEYEVLLAMLQGNKELLASMGIKKDSPVRARNVLADLSRAQHEQESGKDMKDAPTTELVDNVVFHLFPNMWIIHGLQNHGVMWATPGATPDECFHDVMWFKTNYSDEPNPDAPARVDMEFGDEYQNHHTPDIGGTDAMATDQDTDNMEGQQRGLRATPDGFSIFANYAESAIIHDLRLIDEMVNA